MMAICGYNEVDIEKDGKHWSVREPRQLTEIFRISFHWALGDEYLNQSRDFQEALYTCVSYFPLTTAEKEEIFTRFPSLRGKATLGEEDASAGPVRVSTRRPLEYSALREPAPIEQKITKSGIGSRKIG